MRVKPHTHENLPEGGQLDPADALRGGLSSVATHHEAQTLAEVLTAGNSAADQDIIDLNELVASTAPGEGLTIRTTDQTDGGAGEVTIAGGSTSGGGGAGDVTINGGGAVDGGGAGRITINGGDADGGGGAGTIELNGGDGTDGSAAGDIDLHAGDNFDDALGADVELTGGNSGLATPAQVTVAGAGAAHGRVAIRTDNDLGSSGEFLGSDGAGATVWATPATGAPTGADYLVGTTQAGLSAEIVVGTTPGGELGGSWASPTVDATHAGSTHIALSSATPLVESGSGSAGSGTTASKDDHVHPAAASGGSGLGPLLIDSAHSSPIIFGDILQASDFSDLLYGSAP